MPDITFAHNAERYLRSRSTAILRDFVSGVVPGKWHPNGFAVFHLGEVPELGRLRLHVWPYQLRVPLVGQPAIHSHPWELCSLVVAGAYTDTVFRARRAEGRGPGRVRGFTIRFGDEETGDEVLPLDMWYDVEASEHRRVTRGQCHFVVPGLLHETIIGADEFAATLLVTSKAVSPEKLLLLGDGDFPQQWYRRPEVSSEHLARIKTELLAAQHD